MLVKIALIAWVVTPIQVIIVVSVIVECINPITANVSISA